ncbi:hypothetical protein ABT304_10840 [Nocardioides sp. NPDC000445]|uniref:hypothetical protein n=1 Tax=Nocardioides sp. NPDC000445 TaxID=3154257 RepID=UPI003329E3CD
MARTGWGNQMASWLLVIAGAVVLGAVVTVVALVWALSRRAEPGGVIVSNTDAQQLNR